MYMKRLITVSLLLVLFFAKCVFADITPAEEKKIINDAHPFGQHIFDTPLINPETFATQNSLSSQSSYIKSMCHLPGLHCVKIDPREIWVDIFPKPNVQHTMMRLDRTNVALFYRNWLVVPTDWHNLHDWDFSPMPLYRNTHHHRLVVVNLHKFAFGAYDEHGHLLRWGPASSGAKICPENSARSCLTPHGSFRVFKIGGKNCISNTYPLSTKGGAPMPYCMFFHSGFAMHASTLMGFKNMSSGCVRLFIDDAKWLNNNFVTVGTQVDVIG
jgi:L,D-transpeptidase ErfK/SrfK